MPSGPRRVAIVSSSVLVGALIGSAIANLDPSRGAAATRGDEPAADVIPAPLADPAGLENLVAHAPFEVRQSEHLRREFRVAHYTSPSGEYLAGDTTAAFAIDHNYVNDVGGIVHIWQSNQLPEEDEPDNPLASAARDASVPGWRAGDVSDRARFYVRILDDDTIIVVDTNLPDDEISAVLKELGAD